MRGSRDSVVFVGVKAVLFAVYVALFASADPSPSRVESIVVVGVVVALTAAMLALTFTARFRGLPVFVRLVGVIVDFATLMVAFSLGYYLLSGSPGEVPGLETRIDAVYFAMSLLTTVDADITAEGQGARALVAGQMLFSFTYLAVVVTAMGASLMAGDDRNRSGR